MCRFNKKIIIAYLGYKVQHGSDSLSPPFDKKLSLHPHHRNVYIEQNSKWKFHHKYNSSVSATTSPNLDSRKRFQRSIPALDSNDTQFVRLQGNTSPIGIFFVILIY